MTAETIAFIFGCTLVAIVVMMISNIDYHPIQYIRKLRTPPCSKCKNCHIEKPNSDPKDSWLDYLNNCIDLEIYNHCGAGETEYRAGLYKVKDMIESIFDSIDAQ